METKLKELKIGEPYYIDFLEMSVKEWDPKTREMVHKVSKETTDRYQDIVRIAGLDMRNYRKNPVVIYGHDYIGSNPVPIMGKNHGFEIEGKRNPTLWAKTRFWDERKVSPDLADLISDWIFLSNQGVGGWSIGFRVLEYDKILDDDDNWTGYDFTKSDFIEYSGVIIPANQEAVNNALNGAVDAGEMNDERAERISRLVEVKTPDFTPALKSGELWTPRVSLDSEDLNEEKEDPGDGIKKEATTDPELKGDEPGGAKVPIVKQSDLRIEDADKESDQAADFEADFIKALIKFVDGLIEIKQKHKSFFDKFI